MQGLEIGRQLAYELSDVLKPFKKMQDEFHTVYLKHTFIGTNKLGVIWIIGVTVKLELKLNVPDNLITKARTPNRKLKGGTVYKTNYLLMIKQLCILGVTSLCSPMQNCYVSCCVLHASEFSKFVSISS